MEELREDELGIEIDGQTKVMRILFTCDFNGKDVVFCIDKDPDAEEVLVAYYDEKEIVPFSTEEEFRWAENVLSEWQKDMEGSDDGEEEEE